MPQEYLMVAPDGLVHYYPEWFYRVLYGLNRRIVRSVPKHLRASTPRPLLRDKKTGYFRITAIAGQQLAPLLSRELWNLLECGIDAQVVRRELNSLIANTDNTPLPGKNVLESDKVDKIIREVKAKRRRCA